MHIQFSKFRGPVFGVHYSHVYSIQKHMEVALADFDQALQLQPNDARTVLLRGRAHVLDEKYCEALADFDKAQSLENGSSETAYLLRGITWAMRGDTSHCMDEFDRVISLNPKSSKAYFYRGLTQERKGNLRDAIADFTRTIEIDPSNARAYEHRGHLLIQRRDIPGVLQSEIDFRKARALERLKDQGGYAEK